MNRIILSLDNLSIEKICCLLSFMSVKKIPIWGIKVKPTSLIEMCNISSLLKKYSLKLMVDAKLYDTEVAMEDQLEFYISKGADIVTIHVASCFIPKNKSLLNHIAGVTVLTTFDNHTCINIYKECVHRQVQYFAELAESFGYKHIICSANDLNRLEITNIKPICPSIRPDWYKKNDDQVRVATPKQAIEQGAELLIIGRPFTQYMDNLEKMVEVIEQENKEIS